MLLVTGATGFLGSELVRQLVEAGERVRILRRETSSLDLLGDVAERVEHAVGDVTDPDSLPEAFEGIEKVYHSAAYLGFGGRSEAAHLHEVNVEGTANVVDGAREAGVQRLLHTSSMAAFGRPMSPQGVLDEASEWSDSPLNTAYAVSKYRSEREVHRGIAEGLEAVIVNPSLVFGPGRSGENTMRIVERSRKGAILAPAGGTNVVDVADVAACMRAAMARGRSGERYFLGSENLTWVEILTILQEAFGKAGPRIVVPPWLAILGGSLSEALSRLTGRRQTLTRTTAIASSHIHRYSNHKVSTELGCTFRPFAETARRIAEGYTTARGL